MLSGFENSILFDDLESKQYGKDYWEFAVLILRPGCSIRSCTMMRSASDKHMVLCVGNDRLEISDTTAGVFIADGRIVWYRTSSNIYPVCATESDAKSAGLASTLNYKAVRMITR